METESGETKLNEFLLFIMRGFPESIGLISLCLVLSGVPVLWKRVSVFAVFLTLITYIIRHSPIFFGFHSLVIIFLIIGYMWKYLNVLLKKAMISGLLGFFILGILEYMNYIFFLLVMDLDLDLFINSADPISILVFLPQSIAMILLAITGNAFLKNQKEVELIDN